MNEGIVQKLKSLLKALPAATPYAGGVYAKLANEYDLNSLKAELKDLSSAQHAQLLKDLGDLGDKLKNLEDHLGVANEPTGDKLSVIIPCGGKGGSLFPMTQVMPKALVIINFKPLIQHIIDAFFREREIFDKVILTTEKGKGARLDLFR